MRQTFYDYNETCEMIDGSAAIHPHNLGLLMLRGISSTGHFGQVKQCVINAYDTNHLLSADEVMAIILHKAQKMDEDVPASALLALDGPAAPPLPSLRLLLMTAAPIADVDTTHVALSAVVACPTSAAHVAA
jgi:hypothetical protein